MEKLNVKETNSADVIRGAVTGEKCHAEGIYDISCYDANGELKWRDTAPNLVTNQGKDGMMDSYLAGSPALATNWFMSLITAGSATSSSTYASPTVTEVTSGVVATRPTVSWSAASAGSKAATTTSFSIGGSATITGAMLVTATANGSTIGNTAGSGGILFSASNFTGGSKSVTSSDTLQVSYSLAI